MNKKERLIWLLEKFTGLALWTFIMAMGYGILVWTVDYVGNPEIIVHIRIAVGSGIILLFGLFFIFLADASGMEPF